MRTIVYVDGFNFYHLRLKHQRQFRWLNLKALADQLVASPHVITQVNYYTARVSSKIDAQAPAKQQSYLAALATVPEVATHYGRFLFGEKWAFLLQPPAAKPPTYVWNLPGPRMVQVAKVEEKGSDVNLASHLLRDAYLNRFDVALVLFNDTDLVEPIRIVTQEVGKQVGLIAPCRRSAGPLPQPAECRFVRPLCGRPPSGGSAVPRSCATGGASGHPQTDRLDLTIGAKLAVKSRGRMVRR